MHRQYYAAKAAVLAFALTLAAFGATGGGETARMAEAIGCIRYDMGVMLAAFPGEAGHHAIKGVQLLVEFFF